MKKIAIVLALVLLVSVTLVGCKGGVVGVWTVKSVEEDGVALSTEELAMYSDVTLEFKSNGQVFNGGDYSDPATYTVKGNAVTITYEGEVIMTLTKKGKTLIYDEYGEKIVFTK